MGLLEITFPLLTVAGSVGIISAALALGIRHGIDWDHIAAITDITSTAADPLQDEDRWLTSEPAVMLTDESHHSIAHSHEASATTATMAPPTPGGHTDSHIHLGHRDEDGRPPSANGHAALAGFVRKQRPALLLGTTYALGHGGVVLVLGMTAILAREFLPDWIDPVMERVVGVTLIILSAYLFYSIFRFFRGGEEFRMRSRWMLVFAGVRNGIEEARSRVFGKPKRHVHAAQQYGVRTALGIGAIHGIGAETGTQVLVVTTAVGASSQLGGIVALLAFIVGLLISNSVITVISTVGFVSTRQRQLIYVGAGLFAAVFSLVVGTLFLLQSSDLLPGLDRYVDWIGGPD